MLSKKLDGPLHAILLLTLPDINETFKINTNASAFQLGSVVSQKGKPISFYIIKLTDAQ